MALTQEALDKLQESLASQEDSLTSHLRTKLRDTYTSAAAAAAAPTPKLSDLSSEKRAVAIAYAFDVELSEPAICRRLQLDAALLKELLRYVGEQTTPATTRDLNVLLRCASLGSPSPSPGSDLALALRNGIREYPELEPHEAANRGVRKRQERGELSLFFAAVEEYEVYKVANGQAHCEADPEDPQPLILKRRRTLASLEARKIG